MSLKSRSAARAVPLPAVEDEGSLDKAKRLENQSAYAFRGPENVSESAQSNVVRNIRFWEAANDREPGACEVSVVMPCLNEADTLGLCIQKAQTAFREHQIKGEIVVADNGSTDASIEIAERCGARVVHVKEKGYGSALSGGSSLPARLRPGCHVPSS